MKVRLAAKFTREDLQGEPGDEVDIPEELAREFAARGWIDWCEDPSVEFAPRQPFGVA